MDDFHENILMAIEARVGYGRTPAKNSISFAEILTLLEPWYARNGWLMDESQVRLSLYSLVDEGYLVTSAQMYRLTFQGVDHMRGNPAFAGAISEQSDEPRDSGLGRSFKVAMVTIALLLVFGYLLYRVYLR